jgi:hypothetical protein
MNMGETRKTETDKGRKRERERRGEERQGESNRRGREGGGREERRDIMTLWYHTGSGQTHVFNCSLCSFLKI